MNQNTISRYETGEREPSINELIKIADYFNISIDYLLERTNNPTIQKWAVISRLIFMVYHWLYLDGNEIVPGHDEIKGFAFDEIEALQLRWN